MSQAVQLSSKERSLFQQVVKCYESKQYKKGIKSADQILRKTPNHGDTQAMKALLLNSIGSREEAFTLAKLALKNDMKSHVCWHVYGLLWRSVKNFEEGIKAYKFALKLQPESAQILRDLAMLQVQMRDYEGYVQSRKEMLRQRPNIRQNWTAMAIAHHLAGDLKAAEQVLKTYEDTLKTAPPKTDIEHSEAVLYKITIIAEMGDVSRALEELEKVKKTNLDKTAVMEMRAQYLLKLGRKEEAEKAYRALLDRNAEYRAYYDGLEQAMELDQTDKQARKELYASFAQTSERLDAARRIPLDFLDGDDFRETADHYLRRMLKKGVPSTFNNVKALYADSAKQQILKELVESYVSPQTNGNKETNGDNSDSDMFQESALYFLAQHYNYKLSRDLTKATAYIDQLIAAHPKTYDYVMTKARIAKHGGDITEASKLMNQAREIDLKDRYINTKTAKYQLRANDNSAALNTMSLFTRNETLGGTLGDIVDMQALWYITEDGEAYARQGKYAPALKRFHSVLDIFDIWNEDQFDFHNFSLRKGQIRAYIEMVRWEDQLHSHPFYTRAAIDAIKVYLLLHDRPELAQRDYIPGAETMDEEQKKAAQKALKQERIKEAKQDEERREADKKVLAKKATANADGEVKKPDEDPHGYQLLDTKEPLTVAMRFLTPLLQCGEQNLEAQLVAVEVFLRREKYYLALKHLLVAFRLSSHSPAAHALAFRLLYSVKGSDDKALKDLIQSSLPSPYNTTDSSSLPKLDLILHATSSTESNGTSSPSPAIVFAYVGAKAAIEGAEQARAKGVTDLMIGLFEQEREAVSLEDAVQAAKVLEQIDADADTRTRLENAVLKKWAGAKSLLERGSL